MAIEACRRCRTMQVTCLRPASLSTRSFVSSVVPYIIHFIRQFRIRMLCVVRTTHEILLKQNTMRQKLILGHKNKLRLQKWCQFTENSGSVVGAKIRILKIHDELVSLTHCQQALGSNVYAWQRATFIVQQTTSTFIFEDQFRTTKDDHSNLYIRQFLRLHQT